MENANYVSDRYIGNTKLKPEQERPSSTINYAQIYINKRQSRRYIILAGLPCTHNVVTIQETIGTIQKGIKVYLVLNK